MCVPMGREICSTLPVHSCLSDHTTTSGPAAGPCSETAYEDIIILTNSS